MTLVTGCCPLKLRDNFIQPYKKHICLLKVLEMADYHLLGANFIKFLSASGETVGF